MDEDFAHVDPRQLRAHPRNIAIYGEAVDEEVRAAIAASGSVETLTVKRDLTIISGHTRWRVALELALPTVPVQYADFPDEATEIERLVLLNRSRKKSHTQIQREADALAEVAKMRALDTMREAGKVGGQLAGRGRPNTDSRGDRGSEESPKPYDSRKDIAEKLGVSEHAFSKARAVHRTAQGKPTGQRSPPPPPAAVTLAQQLEVQLDQGTISVSKAEAMVRAALPPGRTGKRPAAAPVARRTIGPEDLDSVPKVRFNRAVSVASDGLRRLDGLAGQELAREGARVLALFLRLFDEESMAQLREYAALDAEIVAFGAAVNRLRLRDVTTEEHQL